MDRFLAEELKNKCNEISRESENLEMISKVIEAYHRIIDFANIGRKEGLLALEEALDSLSSDDESQVLFSKMIKLVVEGTEPIIVKSIGINKCITLDEASYKGLINLMYVKGTLMIQAGDNIWVIKEMLQSMLTSKILEIIVNQEASERLLKEAEAANSYQEKINRLCQDDSAINENETCYSIIREISKTLNSIDDEDFYRIIDDTDRNTLALAMKALPGKVRARVFENLSSGEVRGLINDMEYMGPVRLRDAEEACIEIAKTIIDFSENGEISKMDLTVLKLIFAIREANNKGNKAFKDMCEEIRLLIEKYE